MKYYYWNAAGDSDESGRPFPNWTIHDLAFSDGVMWWNLIEGRRIEDWDGHAATGIFDEDVAPTDVPLTDYLVPIHSPRLVRLMEHLRVAVQYLPLHLVGEASGRDVVGYAIANYLSVIDCLDRELSAFQVWTKENLLFWEKRPWMLGTFEDVTRAVLNRSKIAEAPLFRLWGWNSVVIRQDIKQALEEARITGCNFAEAELK